MLVILTIIGRLTSVTRGKSYSDGVTHIQYCKPSLTYIVNWCNGEIIYDTGITIV